MIDVVYSDSLYAHKIFLCSFNIKSMYIVHNKQHTFRSKKKEKRQATYMLEGYTLLGLFILFSL